MAVTVLGEGTDPKEAIEYWKSRIPISSKEIETLSKEVKERAFYVAGLAKLDQVNLIHNKLLEALENGTTIEKFKSEIAEVIKKQGWDKHRIETIFQTNMQTAYQAGRWKGIQRTKDLLPYLEYSSVLDNRTRPQHSVLHGIVFPADHPFWDSHYPPNGFNCRCTALQLSEYQVQKRGLEVQKEMPSGFDYEDPRTGIKQRIVNPQPDPGFANNVGKNWCSEFTPQEIDADTIKDIKVKPKCPKNRSDFSTLYLSGSDCTPPLIDLPEKNRIQITSKDLLPTNLKDEDYILAFLKEFGLKDINEDLFYKLKSLPISVHINKDLFIYKSVKNKIMYKANKNGRGQYMKVLAQVIQNPYEIWRVPVQISTKKTESMRFIRVFDLNGVPFGGYSVFNFIKSARFWSGATVFMPYGLPHETIEYLEEQRQGVLLYREDGKGFLQ